MENYFDKPELLTAYDRNGLYELIVKCEKRRIWSCKTNLSEINQLINNKTNKLYDSVTYDDVDFSLLNIKIDNIKMLITINLG